MQVFWGCQQIKCSGYILKYHEQTSRCTHLPRSVREGNEEEMKEENWYFEAVLGRSHQVSKAMIIQEW